MNKAGKRDYTAVDDFLTAKKPQETQITKDAVATETAISNILEIAVSNRTSIRISDIFDNIKNDKSEGKTHSFYLTAQTYNALAERAKAKNISNSKFLEGILRQLFFAEKD
jgi:hypothetical protein